MNGFLRDELNLIRIGTADVNCSPDVVDADAAPSRSGRQRNSSVDCLLLGDRHPRLFEVMHMNVRMRVRMCCDEHPGHWHWRLRHGFGDCESQKHADQSW